MYDIGEKHLVEIDHVSILELIDERFDGITSLMTQNALMYGSTITAIIANSPIIGDLDIAISSQEFGKLTQRIRASVKWVQVDGPIVQETIRGLSKQHNFSLSPKHSKYTKSKQLPITNIVSFRTVNGACVQIMEAMSMTGDMLEDAISIIRKVDFVFCGMAVDKYGRMLETIPHAYDDCMNKIVRMNGYQHRTGFEQLKQRIAKYVKRGWNLTFSIDQAVSNLRASKDRHTKVMAAKAKKRSKTKSNKPIGMKIKNSHSKGVTIEISSSLANAVNKHTSIFNLISHFAVKYLNDVSMTSKVNTDGSISCWQKYGLLDFDTARFLIKEVERCIKERYGINSNPIKSSNRSYKAMRH